MTIPDNQAGLPLANSRPAASPRGGEADTGAHKNLCKAAQEFEGILISQLLGEFKMGSSGVGEDSPLAGSDTLNSLAVQTLSDAMARNGGLGIGRMLMHQLEPSLKEGGQDLGGGKIKTASRG